MPINPFKEERRCRIHIDERMLIQAKKHSIEYKFLVRECLLKFSVSRKMVENFINDFYISTGDFVVEDGMIKGEKK